MILRHLNFESTQVGFGQMRVGANSNLVPDSVRFVGLSVFGCAWLPTFRDLVWIIWLQH